MINREFSRFLEHMINEYKIKNIIFKFQDIEYTFPNGSIVRFHSDTEKDMIAAIISINGVNTYQFAMQWDGEVNPLKKYVYTDGELIDEIYETVSFVLKFKTQDYTELHYTNKGFRLSYGKQGTTTFTKTDVDGLYRVTSTDDINIKEKFVNYLWITQPILEQLMEEVI